MLAALKLPLAKKLQRISPAAVPSDDSSLCLEKLIPAKSIPTKSIPFKVHLKQSHLEVLLDVLPHSGPITLRKLMKTKPQPRKPSLRPRFFKCQNRRNHGFPRRQGLPEGPSDSLTTGGWLAAAALAVREPLGAGAPKGIAEIQSPELTMADWRRNTETSHCTYTY